MRIRLVIVFVCDIDSDVHCTKIKLREFPGFRPLRNSLNFDSVASRAISPYHYNALVRSGNRMRNGNSLFGRHIRIMSDIRGIVDLARNRNLGNTRFY